MGDCAKSDEESYFLSYSRGDQGYALRLAKDLRAQGIAMFVDQWDIRPSEHWDRAIERAVACCRGMVVIISPRAVASDNVMDEVSFAIDNRKSVLPVLIEKCVLPLRITRMHLIDATGAYDEALQQCLAALRDFEESPEEDEDAPPSPPPPAATPLDEETLSAAKRRLAPIIGPIAGLLVDRAARSARSAKELNELLLKHIDKEEDRQRFIGGRAEAAPPPSKPRPSASDGAAAESSAISAKDLESMAAVLTRYIGPIATIVAKRESRTSSSSEELRQRLAALIPAESDRAEFLRATALAASAAS
jgi:hypothetical protein